MGEHGRDPAPPPLAQWLLGWILGPRDREPMLGDLAEAYARRCHEGRLAADVWYWKEAARSLGPALRRRLGGVARFLAGLTRLLTPGGVLQDLRHGVRSLGRSPGLAASVVVVLSLGIGANSAVFSAVNAVLLRPLPYADSHRLVAVWPGQNFSRRLLDWTREGTDGTLEAVSGYGGVLLTLTDGGPPTEIFAMQVATDYLDVLGAEPVLGRGFLPEDGVPGAEPTAILSHSLWSGRFGGDPGMVGRTIALGGNGEPRRTVVGVMPPDHHPLYGDGVEAWIPVVVDRSGSAYDGSSFMQALGRLAEGVELEQARTQLRGFTRSVQERDPSQYSREEVDRADLMLLVDDLAREYRPPILVAFGGVLLVLLVACGNVALLLLSRAASRGRELSVRAALGAGRGRLARQAVVESLALALVAGGGGLLLAFQARPFLARHLPNFVPHDALAIDSRVIAFALSLSVASALVGSLGPALGAARRDPAEVLSSTRGSRGDRRGGRLQRFLVGGQLAMATTLVAAAALLAKSGREMVRFDPGFVTDGVLTLRVTLPTEEHPDDPSVQRFYEEAAQALRDVPGVAEAGFVSRLPMGLGTSRITVTPQGVERAEGEPAPVATHRLVTPGYLEALRAQVRAGGLVKAEHAEGEALGAVANRTLVERFWPGEDGIGKAIMGPGGVVWLRIVGVVEDLQEYQPGAAPEPGLYIPYTDWAWRTMHAVVRVQGDPAAATPALKEAIWKVSPGVPISRVRTLEDVVLDRTGDVRQLARLGGIFSVFALLLGALGIYGVVAYAVRRRMPELGVRAALGASRRNLLGGELRRHGGIVVAGTGVGLLASLAGGRLLRALLYQVSAYDPLILGGVVAVLCAVGLTAVWLPARKGAAVNPADALRTE